LDVFRRQDDSSCHRDPHPTPVSQRVCDGLADESVGGYGRRMLGAHHRIRIVVFGWIHRAPTSKNIQLD